MAVNYATQYQHKVAERFKKASLTDAACGHDYKFIGARTIVVSSVNTVPLVDFDRTAAGNRFGVPTTLGDTKQEMQMGLDKAFAFDIDAGDQSDQAIDKAAGKSLRREIDEEVIPFVDKTRFSKWAAGAGTVKTGSKLTKSTILSGIIELGGEMSNGLVPEEGRTLYIPIRNYILLVQADAVLSLEKIGQQAVQYGQVGIIDRNKVVPVPDGWFPEDVEFMIKYKNCTVDPVKLQNYHVRKDVQGYDGPVVEGRIYFDSFVLDARKAGVGVFKLG